MKLRTIVSVRGLSVASTLLISADLSFAASVVKLDSVKSQVVLELSPAELSQHGKVGQKFVLTNGKKTTEASVVAVKNSRVIASLVKPIGAKVGQNLTLTAAEGIASVTAVDEFGFPIEQQSTQQQNSAVSTFFDTPVETTNNPAQEQLYSVFRKYEATETLRAGSPRFFFNIEKLDAALTTENSQIKAKTKQNGTRFGLSGFTMINSRARVGGRFEQKSGKTKNTFTSVKDNQQYIAVYGAVALTQEIGVGLELAQIKVESGEAEESFKRGIPSVRYHKGDMEIVGSWLAPGRTVETMGFVGLPGYLKIAELHKFGPSLQTHVELAQIFHPNVGGSDEDGAGSKIKEDPLHIAVGADYSLSESLKGLAELSYDESTLDDTVSGFLPIVGGYGLKLGGAAVVIPGHEVEGVISAGQYSDKARGTKFAVDVMNISLGYKAVL